MSAAVCGSKRSYLFDDLPSPPVTKRLRCGSSSSGGSASPSPVRFTPPPPSNSLIDRLKAVFPATDPQLLEEALEECGNDLDAAIRTLHELSQHKSGSDDEVGANVEQGTLTNNGDSAATENSAAPNNLPANGAEWVDLFVKEMLTATSIDDARARASKVLEILEKSISASAAEGAAQNFQKENMMLKEQIAVVMRENSILKRAVAIQHERQKEFENVNHEAQHLKQLLSQYQEQLRTLEVNNYALRMHLKQAEQSSPIPGRFNPDVF